jgi:PBP1b-binding outer membrane lipoprotein LpoB
VIRKKSSFLIVLFVAVVAVGCSKTANTNTTVNVTGSTTNTAATNTNAAPPETGTAAGSPTEAYKAAYAARKNCDIPGLKKVMSKDIQSFLTDMGKGDKKSLDDMLKELCTRPQAATAEARNETIDGDHASLEYLAEDGKWERMDFVKEDGVWKMSIGPGGEEYPTDDVPKKGGKDDNRS